MTALSWIIYGHLRLGILLSVIYAIVPGKPKFCGASPNKFLLVAWILAFRQQEVDEQLGLGTINGQVSAFFQHPLPFHSLERT